MAVIIKLVRAADGYSAGVESLDLLDYTAGIELQDNGWIPNVADDEQVEAYTPIEEVLNLYLKGSSHDTMAAYDVALKKFLRKARWYSDSQEQYGLWLRTKLHDETYERQALITRIAGGKTNVMSMAAWMHSHTTEYPIVLQRMPLWEDKSTTEYSLGGLNSAGGMATVSSVPGTDPVRIPMLIASPLTELWFGFKTTRHITDLSQFTCPWELENGTPGTDTAVDHDTDASPGGAGHTKMACNFSTTSTMATRVSLTGANIGVPLSLRGTYHAILIAKCANAVSANVRLGIGAPDSLSYTYNSPVVVSGTSYSGYDLGRFTFPAGGKSSPWNSPGWGAMGDLFCYNTTLLIQAELASGSPVANALDVDCIVPVPVDDGFGHIALAAGSTPGKVGEIYCFPNGVISGAQYTLGNSPDGIPDMRGTCPATFNVPVGTSKLVVAASNSKYSTKVDVTIYAIHRWRTLRGSET